jgi:hypothetical protein
MSTSSSPRTVPVEPKAIDCRFADGQLIVRLDDGREVRSPIASHRRLHGAAPSQLANWTLVGRGIGLHWPELDEDLSVAGLLRDGVVVGAHSEDAPPSWLSWERLRPEMVRATVSVVASGASPLAARA